MAAVEPTKIKLSSVRQLFSELTRLKQKSHADYSKGRCLTKGGNLPSFAKYTIFNYFYF